MTFALELPLKCIAASAEEPVQVGLQKQLLVDDYVIAQKENITRELGRPKKVGIVAAQCSYRL